MVGLDGFEPSTSRLSGVRSNRTELQAHKPVYYFSSFKEHLAFIIFKIYFLLQNSISGLSKLNSRLNNLFKFTLFISRKISLMAHDVCAFFLSLERR